MYLAGPATQSTAGAAAAISLSQSSPQVADFTAAADDLQAVFWRYIMPAMITAIVALLGLGIGTYFTRRNAISEHWLRTNSLEIASIQERLDKFWGPYLILMEANHLQAQDIRDRQETPEMYRMLPSLFDSAWLARLSPGERALVRDVCETGERLSAHIVANCGMVDVRLIPFLSRAIAHWRVLKLAAEGRLGADGERFLRYVYPSALDQAVRQEVLRLTARLDQLRSAPARKHGPMQTLNLDGIALEPWPDRSRPSFKEGEGLVLDDREIKTLWESLNEQDKSSKSTGEPSRLGG